MYEGNLRRDGSAGSDHLILSEAKDLGHRVRELAEEVPFGCAQGGSRHAQEEEMGVRPEAGLRLGLGLGEAP